MAKQAGGRVGSSKYKLKRTTCECTVSCEYQGEEDVRRRIAAAKYRDNVKGIETQHQSGQSLRPTTNLIHDKAIRAEVTTSTVLAPQ